MSSILTNNSAMNALSTLRNINSNLDTTQNRISTGKAITSGKDNAAYFSISETMKGDSGMTKSINEGLTLTKNVIATSRLGAETVSDLAQQFTERVAFAQAEGVEEHTAKAVAKAATRRFENRRIGGRYQQAATDGRARPGDRKAGFVRGDAAHPPQARRYLRQPETMKSFAVCS